MLVALWAVHVLKLQSKHIVIYDTLINQSTPEEIEAVLGESNNIIPLFRRIVELTA